MTMANKHEDKIIYVADHIVGTQYRPIPILTRHQFFIKNNCPNWSKGELVLYVWGISDLQEDGVLYKISKITVSEVEEGINFTLTRVYGVDFHQKILSFFLNCAREDLDVNLKEHLHQFVPINNPATTALMKTAQLYLKEHHLNWTSVEGQEYSNTLLGNLQQFTLTSLNNIFSNLYHNYYSSVLYNFESANLCVHTSDGGIPIFKYAKNQPKSICTEYLVSTAFEFAYNILDKLQNASDVYTIHSHDVISEKIYDFLAHSSSGYIFDAWNIFCDICHNIIVSITKREEQPEDKKQYMHTNISQESNEHQEISDAEEFLNKMNSLTMPSEAYDKIRSEIIRMGRMPPYSQEYESIRNWLDKTLSLPWGLFSSNNNKLPSDIRSSLDKNHYGLTKVKDVITEHLGLLIRRARLNIQVEDADPIVCLVGPPGVGKSTIAKSIAGALGRKFERIALGGLKDIHELKGHRKTYLGAVHGAIIDRLISAKVSNPVILLDEIDKLSQCQNNISAMLLDILDAEQNNKYRDAFIDIDYDISRVMFIATANSENFDPALTSRMNIMEVEGYSIAEKIEISNRFLLPKLCKNSGVNLSDLDISNKVIQNIITKYTFESGVRELNRSLHKIVTKIALQMENDSTIVAKHSITEANTYDYLGSAPYSHKYIINEAALPIIGSVNGLAVMKCGGGLLMQVEASSILGKGRIHVTGNLGKVMNEAASVSHIVARQYIMKTWGNTYRTADKDVYLHYPTATPKDGSSAGVATCIAVISALTSKPLRRDFAVTGEINLHGGVMRIGGVKDKVQAAIMSGMKTVFLPRDNAEEAAELPQDMRNMINLIYVDSIEDVIIYATDTGIIH
jgi:endopeptidase La